VRSSRALREEKKEFLTFVEKKLSVAPDIAAEAYEYLIDAQSQDGLIDEAILEKAVDAERSLAGISRPIPPGEIVDYRFLREALASLKGLR
jgi:hypothetical protein